MPNYIQNQINQQLATAVWQHIFLTRVRHWRIIVLVGCDIVEIIETSVFTRQVDRLLSDDEYRLLQNALVLNPELGSIIPGGGGIRKVRWKTKDRGKRGGTRAIYFWAVNHEIIFMLTIYSKSEQDNLTPNQLRLLRRFVDQEFP